VNQIYYENPHRKNVEGKKVVERKRSKNKRRRKTRRQGLPGVIFLEFIFSTAFIYSLRIY
jgi:hypothetical protein